MEHVVFFPAPDGTPGFRRTSHLEDAVRLVEHLRNVEGIESVGVYSLTEVPLSFRTYYRVEVPQAQEDELLPPDLPSVTPAADVVPITADQPDEPYDQSAVPGLAEPASAEDEPAPALALVEEPATVQDTRARTDEPTDAPPIDAQVVSVPEQHDAAHKRDDSEAEDDLAEISSERGTGRRLAPASLGFFA